MIPISVPKATSLAWTDKLAIVKTTSSKPSLKTPKKANTAKPNPVEVLVTLALIEPEID